MSDERGVDRRIHDWLELGPDRAPDRLAASVLRAIEATPQVRGRRRSTAASGGRAPRLSRSSLIAATAAALLVLLAGTLWLGQPPRFAVGPAITDSPVPSATSPETPQPASATPESSEPRPTPSGIAPSPSGIVPSPSGIVPSPSPSASATTPASASPSPTVAPAPLRNVVAIGTGVDITCALIQGGTVDCWGDSFGGVLGTGGPFVTCDKPVQLSRTSCSKVPVPVGGLIGVAALSVGGSHACALTVGGGLKCWGLNDNGQLGDGTNASSGKPVEVVGLASGVAAVSAGYLGTCALTVTGAVKCWGDNTAGGLGNGSTATASNVPVDVTGLSDGVAAISSNGAGACALLVGGAVKCWGGGFSSLLAGSTSVVRTPVAIAGLGSGVVAVSVGGSHACVIVAGGQVKCWGDNLFGSLGNGSTDRSPTPVLVPGLSGVTAIAASGYLATCALVRTGGVKCWGFNTYGQVGDGTTSDRTSPVDVIGLTSGVVAISAHGYQHACALMANGGVRCWGGNEAGELGDGSQLDRWTPVDVAGR